MDNYIKKYLLDVLQSISHMEEFTKTVNSFFDYEDDLLVRRAVERELEIIGEALNRTLKINSEIEILNARRIVDLRNRVIHDMIKLTVQ